MIIDAHTHVSDTEYGNIDLLIEQMDAAGVTKAVIVPGGHRRRPRDVTLRDGRETPQEGDS